MGAARFVFCFDLVMTIDLYFTSVAFCSINVLSVVFNLLSPNGWYDSISDITLLHGFCKCFFCFEEQLLYSIFAALLCCFCSDLWFSSLSYAAQYGLLLSLAFVLTRGQMCGYIMELEICEGWPTRWISVLLSWAHVINQLEIIYCFLPTLFLILCLLYTG